MYLGWFLVLAAPIVLLYIFTIPKCEQREDGSGYTLLEYLKVERSIGYRASLAFIVWLLAFSIRFAWPWDGLAALGMMLMFETILFASCGSRKFITIVLLVFSFACIALAFTSG